MSDTLVGLLGVPGAVLAVLGAALAIALGAIKLWRTLKDNGKHASTNAELDAERRTYAAVKEVVAEIAKTRHALIESLAAVEAAVLRDIRELRQMLERRP